MKKRKIKDLVKNNLLSLGLVLIILFSVVVIAGDVIVDDGELSLEENLIVDGSDFFVNTSSGKVGIGISAPIELLHLKGVSGGNTVIQFSNDVTGDTATDGFALGIGSDDNYYVFGRETNKNLYLGTNNTVRMTIKDGGNVGIGTTTPTHTLNVVGNTKFIGDMLIQSSTFPATLSLGTNDVSYSLLNLYGHSDTTPGILRLYKGAGSDTNVDFWRLGGYTSTGGFMIGANGNTPKFIIDAATFNVGIGTTAPSYPLTVIGSSGDISIYAEKNISATGFITRTSLYDGSNVWDYIKDVSYFDDGNGEAVHNNFYGYVSWEATDYSRPVEVEADGETVITYPYNATIEGVSLDDEVNLLRQAVYELRTELCKNDNSYGFC